MAVTYRASLKTTRMTDVKTDIDSGGAAGTIEIGTSGMGTVLAVLPLSYPCGTVSGDTLTFGTITADSSADATGTAAEARIKNSAGTVIVSGLTVSTSGANVNLTSTSVVTGGNVAITSGTITHG